MKRSSSNGKGFHGRVLNRQTLELMWTPFRLNDGRDGEFDHTGTQTFSTATEWFFTLARA